MRLLEVDDNGFDEVDRKLLRTIIDKFNGGPVGVNSLAAAINEEKDAIEDIYEPFLIQGGFLDRRWRRSPPGAPAAVFVLVPPQPGQATSQRVPDGVDPGEGQQHLCGAVGRVFLVVALLAG